MRKPELLDICKWITEAWAVLHPAIIVKALKTCCISNKIGGTETDIIWEDRHPVIVEGDNTCDDEVDYSEENAL